MKNQQFSLGIVIIALGLFILLGKLGIFQFVGSMLWPLFVLLPGLIFHVLFFYRVLPSGVLIPGGILVLLSLMFFFCNLVGWDAMAYLWPGFIAAVALGLYEFYLFDSYRPRAALIGAVVLGIIAAVFFAFILLFSSGVYFLAAVLIAAGIFLLMRRPKLW